MITDIAASVAPLKHAGKMVDRWARREKKPVMVPLGLLGAGNRAMVKASEFTPATVALSEKLAPRYFDLAELAFVSGGADVSKAFAALLPFDHLLFTGATGIGRHIPARRGRQSDASDARTGRQVARDHRSFRQSCAGDRAGGDGQDRSTRARSVSRPTI